MKSKFTMVILGIAILVSGLIFTGVGAYLKYGVLAPRGLGEEYNIVQIPFAVLTDDGLQYAIAMSTAPTTTAPETTVPETTVPETTVPETTVPETTAPETTPPTTTPPTTTEPPTTAAPETLPPVISSTSYPGYDFSAGAVGDDWYSDVLFIGDSRTVGLRDYARSGNADYFCGVGMTVFTVRKSSTTASDRNFSDANLTQVLSSKTYGKVIISLGINECGYDTGSILSAYRELIATVRELQPGAKIILQNIITVTRNYAGGRSYFQPDHINSINRKIANLADNATVFYIDCNPYFTDAEGYLYTDITGDGCHFYGKYYGEWAKWIRYAVGNQGI